MANQIVEEGGDSPADVFLTENSPAMSIVDNAGLFAPVPQARPRQHPRGVRPELAATGPASWPARRWSCTTPTTSPRPTCRRASSTSPTPSGRAASASPPPAPTSRPSCRAVLELEGEEATRTWLEGLAANGVVLQNNLVVMQAADAGEVDAGIAYHYYWYRDREESGTDSDNSELYFFGDQDPGAFLSVSGAGILESSEHAEARRGVRRVADLHRPPSRRWPSPTRWSTRSTRTPSSTGDVKPFDELEPPDRRRRQPQRSAGDRADDRGRPALRTGARTATPPLLLAAGVAVALLALIPLVYVATYTVIIGPAELWDLVVRPRVARAAPQHRDPGRGHHGRDRGARHRRWRSSSSAPTCRPGGCGTACWSRRWPCRPSSTATPGCRWTGRSTASAAPGWW